MTNYKELAEHLEAYFKNAHRIDEVIAILRSLDAQKPIGYWGGAFSIEGGADLYEVEQVSAFGRVYKNLPLYAAPVAAQPPSQPVDPVHVINTAIDVMMRRDATIAGVLFDFMGWLTTRKERLCLSSADDASPAVTAITEFAKMRNLSLDNAMVTDWQSGAAQASKPLPTELDALRQQKDGAYFERNQVVAALAKCFPSGVSKTAIEGWSEDWHGCVYIDLPTGQVSWHFHDSQAYLFKDLPPYAGAWDGHDTPEKYRRVNALAAQAGLAL